MTIVIVAWLGRPSVPSPVLFSFCRNIAEISYNQQLMPKKARRELYEQSSCFLAVSGVSKMQLETFELTVFAHTIDEERFGDRTVGIGVGDEHDFTEIRSAFSFLEFLIEGDDLE
jgi:hypothetical protein